MNGLITAIRFYKGVGNTGTHIGHLWTSTGQLLASATFTSETATGWQQVSFPTPVAVTAGTIYIASYFAPNGHHAGNQDYFTANGADGTTLHAPSSGASGGNGVYAYGATSTFPNQSYSGSNYWVDVVLSAPPQIIAATPAAGATGISTTAAITITFDR